MGGVEGAGRNYYKEFWKYRKSRLYCLWVRVLKRTFLNVNLERCDRVVTLGDTVIFTLGAFIILGLISLFLFLLFLRSRYKQKTGRPFFMTTKNQGVLMGTTLGLVIILFVLTKGSIRFNIVTAIVLALGSLLISLLILLLRQIRKRFSGVPKKVQIRYIFRGGMVGALLVCLGLMGLIYIFFAAVIFTLLSITAFILLLIFQRISIKESNAFARANILYILLPLMLSSVLTFFIWSGLLKGIATREILSAMESLKNSPELHVWNSYPQFSGSQPWGEEEIIVTDKQVILQFHNTLRRCNYKYELVLIPNVFATRNAISVFQVKNDRRTEGFVLVSNTIQIRSWHRYKPSDKQLLRHCREVIGAKNSD